MKLSNASRILSMLAIGVIIIGAMLKIMHWPYSGLLLTIGLGAFSISYFLLGLLYKLPDAYTLIWQGVFKTSALLISIAAIAAFLRFHHYPYGYGLGLLTLVGLPTGLIGFFFAPAEEEDKVYQHVSKIAMIIGGVGLFTLLH